MSDAWLATLLTVAPASSRELPSRAAAEQSRRRNAMALTRASCQSTGTLRGFYGELAESSDGVTSSIGKRMLELLPMLEELCATRATWGLTSHAHLWLLPSDDWRSPWLVCVTAHPGMGFHIRYRIPEADAPWPDAIVEGEAKDVAHACQLIAIAMDRSQGWNGS